MALTDESNGNGMVMPVQPMGGSYGGNMGGLGFGGDWAWILLLLVLGGGWGGFGGFGMGGAMMGMGMMDGFGLYPWLNNSQNINDGFRDQMLNTSVNGIQNAITSGFGDVQTALCGGFAGVNQNVSQGFANTNLGMCQGFNGVNTAISGAQNAITQQMYTNQIADLERSFAAQTANTAAIYGVNSSLQNCCCENRAGLADVKYTIATENCADRAALADGIRDVLAATQAQTQTILDKMCQQEIDALKAQNLELQNRVNMQNLAASQAAQTAALVADNTAQTQYIVNRVAPYPIPAYTVANPVTPATATA